MLLVSTDRLTPGVAVAIPVPHPQRPDTCLLQANVRLTDKLIGRLGDLGIPHVWVKHDLLGDLASKINRTIPERRRHIFEAVANGFDALQDRVITTADHAHYCEVIGELITDLLEDTSQVGVLAERLFDDGDELCAHSANVAYLAVTIGMHLEGYILQQRRGKQARPTRELCHLGAGALLHDIGKLSWDPELRSQHATTPDRHDAYPRHTHDGFLMLRNRVNALAGTVALHHHQQWDGTGWPDMTALTGGRIVGGMAGQNIHVFSRIVAAANAFDNLTSGAAGSPRPAVDALHHMQSDDYAGVFDPVVLGAFLRFIPPFPVGVEVVLSDGGAAAVVAMHSDDPCRPTVRRLDGPETGSEIDLRPHDDPHIRYAQGHRVDRWLYRPPAREEAMATTGP
ncbi:MAG: HD-GYP domain-containing protein [Planctomycetota bacterium]